MKRLSGVTFFSMVGLRNNFRGTFRFSSVASGSRVTGGPGSFRRCMRFALFWEFLFVLVLILRLDYRWKTGSLCLHARYDARCRMV